MKLQNIIYKKTRNSHISKIVECDLFMLMGKQIGVIHFLNEQKKGEFSRLQVSHKIDHCDSIRAK